MSAAASAQAILTVEFFGLTPGDEVEASIQFHYGKHGMQEINYGMSAQPVQLDGSVTFTVNTHILTRGNQGDFTAWARPQGSLFGQPSDALVGSRGKCVIHGVHLP